MFTEGGARTGRANSSIWDMVETEYRINKKYFVELNVSPNISTHVSLARTLVDPRVVTRSPNLCNYLLREEPGQDMQTAPYIRAVVETEYRIE